MVAAENRPGVFCLPGKLKRRNMSELVQITGLWSNVDKNGKKYLSGYMGNAKVLILENGFKEEEKQPDYILYVAPKKKDGEQTEKSEETIPF